MQRIFKDQGLSERLQSGNESEIKKPIKNNTGKTKSKWSGAILS